MRTLFALMAAFVIWNGVTTAAVDRPRPDGDKPQVRDAAVVHESARLTIHGRLQFIGLCLPGETGLWSIEVGDQSYRLSLVNEELTKKAHGFGSQPVTIQGYLRNGQVIVESVQLDERPEASPSVEIQLQGKLGATETALPYDKGFCMTIDGERYWLHLSDKTLKTKGFEPKEGITVLVHGTLERCPDGNGVALVVHVKSVSHAFMK